jgi:predicted nucleic acid-binding protein
VIAFLDSSALIYLMEGAAPLAAAVREHLLALQRANPGLQTAISRLAHLECRVQPLKRGNQALLTRYDGFFARPDLICVELSASVVDLATLLRARYGLKTPDALHTASCLQLGDDHLFLTGDTAFPRVDGLRCKLIPG